jgi:dipeptidyl aminopeptidase/acylaminoacyl peptidase
MNRGLRGSSAAAAVVFAMLLGAAAPPAAAQVQPETSVDEKVVALDWAPDGRIVYAVERVIRVRRVDMQRDDIWLLTPDGKRRRIVNGQKLVQGGAPFSYAVRSLRWSADGRRMTAELQTVQFTDDRGTTREVWMSLLLDENGKEIKIQGADSVIPGGHDAAWLGDGVTVAYLAEAVEPRLLFSVNTVRPVAGRGRRLFEKLTFAAAAFHPREPWCVAVERSATLTGPPRLVRLDLEREELTELAELESFSGQLTISPSGKSVAYFRDPNTLEIRALANPAAVTRVTVPVGAYQWAPDERRVLLRRGTDRRSGALLWVSIPDGQITELFHGLGFRDFALAPDGRRVAVTQPGSRNLLVFPIE